MQQTFERISYRESEVNLIEYEIYLLRMRFYMLKNRLNEKTEIILILLYFGMRF